MKNTTIMILSLLLSSCVPTMKFNLRKPLEVQPPETPVAENPSITISPNTFNFNSAIDYTTSDASIVVDQTNNNLVKLLALDQIDNLTTGAGGDLGFQSGDATRSLGVIYNSGNKITLNATLTNTSDLDKFWTPQYSHLIGYWKLNGTVGAISNGATVVDEIASHNGVVSGSGLSYVNQNIKQSISGFGAATDFIDIGVVPALSNLSQVTIGAWIYTTNLTTVQTIAGLELEYKIEMGSDGGGHYGFPNFIIGDGSSWKCNASFPSNLEVNKWYYITGVYNGSTATVYVNGVKGNSCNNSGATGTSAHKMLIGGWDSLGATVNEPFQGSIDEVQVWDRGLTETEVKTIAFKQLKKHSGTYYSRIMEGPKVITDWTNFGVKIPYPLRPVSTTIDPAAYTGQTTNFSTNLIALYHLDQATMNSTANEIVDSSVNGLHGTKHAGVTVTNSIGVWGNAATINGADFIEVPDNNLLDGQSKMSFSMWAYRGDNMATSGLSGALFGKRNGYGVEHAYAAFIEDATGQPATDGKLCIDIDTADDRFCSNASFPYLQWVHVVITFDGTDSDPNNRVKLYLNGVLDKTAAETSTSIPNYASNLVIGAMQNNGTYTWIGMIDEFGMWNRTFNLTEVQELYRRGANNAAFQVRTCANSDCSDRTLDSGWIGTDGTQNSFFSEATNTSLTTTPYFDFTGIGSLASWLATENKKYFQYRAVLESSSSTLLPEVTEVAVGPTHYSASSFAASTASGSIPFGTLTTFSEVLGGGGCAGGVTYQLATGGSGWKYWDGSTWASASTVVMSNNVATVNTNIAAFASQFRTGSTNENLYLKTILNSSGTTSCEVDTVTIDGLKF